MGRCSGALPRDGSNRSPPAPLSPASPSSPPTPLCTLNTPGQAWPTGQHLAGTLPFARLAGTYYVCDPVPCTEAPGWAAGTVLATPKCPHFAQARKVKVSPRFWPSLLAQAESCGSRLGRAAVIVAMEMTMSESGCWHPTGPGPQMPAASVCPAAFFPEDSPNSLCSHQQPSAQAWPTHSPRPLAPTSGITREQRRPWARGVFPLG